MKMKTLTVNGQSFSVIDGGAVRYEENQALTETEKARARENIGAAQAFGQTQVEELITTHAPGVQGEDTSGLRFSGQDDAPVELMHLLEGQSDDSAATVGQAKNIAARAAIDILLELDLIPALTDADGGALVEADGTILLNG